MAVEFDPDCGCPVEELVIWPFEVLIHLEPDGTGDIWLDNGDWETELNVEASSMDELRVAAQREINKIISDWSKLPASEIEETA